MTKSSIHTFKDLIRKVTDLEEHVEKINLTINGRIDALVDDGTATDAVLRTYHEGLNNLKDVVHQNHQYLSGMTDGLKGRIDTLDKNTIIKVQPFIPQPKFRAGETVRVEGKSGWYTVADFPIWDTTRDKWVYDVVTGTATHGRYFENQIV